jgi:hypothetical protein
MRAAYTTHCTLKDVHVHQGFYLRKTGSLKGLKENTSPFTLTHSQNPHCSHSLCPPHFPDRILNLSLRTRSILLLQACTVLCVSLSSILDSLCSLLALCHAPRIFFAAKNSACLNIPPLTHKLIPVPDAPEALPRKCDITCDPPEVCSFLQKTHRQRVSCPSPPSTSYPLRYPLRAV